MRIGELSAATGTPVRTIRFYEEKGILPNPNRTHAGYRIYDQESLNRLRFLRTAQDAGLTLSEIAGILMIRANGGAPCDHTRGLLEARRAEILARLENLEELGRELDELIERGRAIDAATCRAEDICSVIPIRP